MKRVSTSLVIGLILLAAATLPVITAGAQPSGVTWDNLSEKIADSKTAADHEAIAAFYKEQAAETKQKAQLHRESAETYRKLKIAKPVYMAEMCDGVAAMWDKIAADYDKLAAAHEEMAKKAGS